MDVEDSGAASARSIPQLSQSFTSTRAKFSTRIVTAFVCEGRMSIRASKCKDYVRSFEGAECDGALVVDENANVPNEPTNRFFELKKHYGDAAGKTVVPIDFKSHEWYNAAKFDPTGVWRKEFVLAQMVFSTAQMQKCQVVVVTNFATPGWIAVIPKPYLEGKLIKVPYQHGALVRHFLKMGVITEIIQRQNPLPPLLIPFVMPSSMLEIALSNLVAFTKDPANKLYNPFTGLVYSRCEDWRPATRPFRDLYPAHSTELTIREKLYNAFKAYGLVTGFKYISPEYAPLTSDVRLDHTSGTSVFVEIKVGMWKLKVKPFGVHEFSHAPYLHTSVGIFTFQATWDYLLTTDNLGKRGYLIKRDDIPTSFWHSDPGEGNFLVHEYDDASFLDKHKIDLTRGVVSIASDFRRIICGENMNARPQKATLTSQQIVQQCGPCPKKLLMTRAEAGADNIADILQPEGGDVAENFEGDEQDPDEELLGDNDDQEEEEDAAEPELLEVDTDRKRVQGQIEVEQNAQVFNQLMRECRKTGKGCPMWLGLHHPMGPIGMVRHTWGEQDKIDFDIRGIPPCWIGTLPNETPVITLTLRFTRWLVNKDFAPDEGTRQQHTSMVRAQPCLVFCTALPREQGHVRQQCWLVPSGYLCDLHLGNLYDNGKDWNRLALFLDQKIAIDRFAVDSYDLHATVTSFLDGSQTINIGNGQVQVDNPSQYLRTVREVRTTSDEHFDLCHSGGLRMGMLV